MASGAGEVLAAEAMGHSCGKGSVGSGSYGAGSGSCVIDFGSCGADFAASASDTTKGIFMGLGVDIGVTIV
jgi:hypothetical protein